MRLVAQGLIEPVGDVAEVARWLTCTQGQDHPGAMRSLALRTSGRRLQDVRSTYDAGQIVRGWPMRGTLFVTAAEDLEWITALTAEKMLGQAARRRAELGLDAAALDRAEEIARTALPGAGLSRSDLIARFGEAGLGTRDGRSYHLLSHLTQNGVICLGPMASETSTDQRFVLQEEWIPAPRRPDRADAVRELLVRYVRARGPVPLDDFCWWSKLGKVESRAALADVSDQLISIEVDGKAYLMPPDLPDRYAALRRRTAAPILLPGFDEIVLGYGDRRAVLTPAEEMKVVPGKNGVFKATVLHRGHAVGTWRRSRKTGEPVEVEPFTSLPPAVVTAVPRLTARLPQ